MEKQLVRTGAESRAHALFKFRSRVLLKVRFGFGSRHHAPGLPHKCASPSKVNVELMPLLPKGCEKRMQAGCSQGADPKLPGCHGPGNWSFYRGQHCNRVSRRHHGMKTWEGVQRCRGEEMCRRLYIEYLRRVGVWPWDCHVSGGHQLWLPRPESRLRQRLSWTAAATATSFLFHECG